MKNEKAKVCRQCEVREDIHIAMTGKKLSKGLCIGCEDLKEHETSKVAEKPLFESFQSLKTFVNS